MTKEVCLITEDAFHTLYLLEEWQSEVSDGEILIRGDKPDNLPERIAFLQKHAGKHGISKETKQEIINLFGGLSKSEEAMIERYGIPKVPIDLYAPNRIAFIGKDLNAGDALKKAEQWCSLDDAPQIFVFLDQIFKDEKWLELADKKKIINAHSAVLPYAPGMHSIECVAAKFDAETLTKCAGSTLHYVDKGVDTGAIIKAEKLNFLQYDKSIWHVKSRSYKQAFQQLTGLAKRYQVEQTLPLGEKNNVSKQLVGSPFTRKDFAALGVEQAAETNFKAYARKQLSPQGMPFDRDDIGWRR